MTCVTINTHHTRAIVCLSPCYRLPLEDGRRVFMEWHHYCGPTFYHDRLCQREIEVWWDDDDICAALDWFIKRGKRA